MGYCLDDAQKLDYLNGMLSEEERVLFEKHLALCPGCRREIAELRKMADAVAALTLPTAPAAWAAAAKDRLRAKGSSSIAAAPPSPALPRRRTNVLRYVAIAACVTAGFVLLFWLFMGETVQRWLPGLSTAALGISEPRAARTANLAIWILSLHALLFIPSIIETIYQLTTSNAAIRELFAADRRRTPAS